MYNKSTLANRLLMMALNSSDPVCSQLNIYMNGIKMSIDKKSLISQVKKIGQKPFGKNLTRFALYGVRKLPVLAVILLTTTFVLYLTVGPGAAGSLKLTPVTEPANDSADTGAAAETGSYDLDLAEYEDLNRGAYWDYLIQAQTETNLPNPQVTTAPEPTKALPSISPTAAPSPPVTPPPLEMDEDGVVIEPLVPEEFTKDDRFVYISAFEANVRQAPQTDVDILYTATMGDKLKRTGYGDFWSQVSLADGRTGYVYNELISETVIYKPESITDEAQVGSDGPVQAPAAADDFKKDKRDIYVKSSIANIRSGPGTDSSILQKASQGDKFSRTAVSAQWSRIELAGGKIGYIFNDLISTKKISQPAPSPTANPTPSPTKAPSATPAPTAAPEKEPVKDSDFTADEREIYIKANTANIRSGPATDTTVLQKASLGDKFMRTAVSAQWSRISLADGKTAYIFNDLISTEVVNKPKPVEPGSTPATSGLSQQQKQDIVDLARSMLGVKYVYGSAKPSGFDCSGLTTYIYKTLHGITLPRSAKDQAHAGKKVSSSEITVGDIICFDWSKPYGVCDHVGIYIGNGQYIHASYSAGKVKLSEVNFSRNPIVSIRRIIP